MFLRIIQFKITFYVLTSGVLFPSLIESDCTFPANRVGLIAFYQATDEQVTSNELIPDGGVLAFNCTRGWNLIGEKSTYCEGTSWGHTIPTCEKFCSKWEITQSASTVTICDYKNAVVPCGDQIRPGTRARIKCAEGYNLPSAPVKDTLTCGEDGDWDSYKFNCVQKCGEVFDSIVPFVSGGFPTNITEVPWQVAIYGIFDEQRYRHICSGAIITPKLVVSAAHCFWDEANLKPYKQEYFIIIAGKYYVDYDAKEKYQVQNRNLSEIIVHANFTGRDSLFQNDIAVMVLANELLFSSHVMPICIEFPDSEDRSVASDILGRFAGWGTTESGTRAKELRSIQLRTVGYNKCREQLLPAAVRYRLTEDKFCIFDEYGASLCSGDSGGGFAQPKRVSNSDKLRYYLLGVLSNAPNPNSVCTVQSITAMTNVYFFRNFIVDIVNKYKQPLASSVYGCHIPADVNLVVNYVSNNDKYPALGIAPDSGVIQFSCKRGYTLVGSTGALCSKGVWNNPAPMCIRYCSKHAIAKSLSSVAVCDYKNKPVECGDQILPGTRAKIKCNEGFEIPDNVDDALICGDDGEWNNPKFNCNIQCGKIPETSSSEKYNAVPWMVAIYDVEYKKDQRHICSGTIISPKVVITAAYCFLDPPSIPKYNKDFFRVIAGKQYSDITAKEKDSIQERDVADIVIHPDYKGRTDFYKSNIAILVPKTQFSFDDFIVPICLRFRSSTDAAVPSDILGRFPGWGVSEKRLSVKELLTTQVSTLSYEKCLAQIPRGPRSYLTDDKFCFFEYNGCNVYEGDGGAGFAQPQRIPGGERAKYSLLGVLSFQFNSDVHCIRTLTNINYYLKFITDAINRNNGDNV